MDGHAPAAGGVRAIAVRPDGDRFEFGRKGQGPGEFAGATSVVALANGHSIVPDYGRDIFHEYLPNGQFRRQVRMGDLADALDLIYRADGGIAMSDSSAYAVKILDANGQVARIIRRSLPSRAITVAMQETYRSQELKALSVKMIGLLRGDPGGRWPAALGPDGRVAYIGVDDLDVPTVLIGQLSVRRCGG